MKDLFSFLNNASNSSDFKAKLSERGGFITFSNSGRRGGIKFFQIGLDNILQTLKDILDNIEIFRNLTEYEETPWRNNGSEYFTDPVANANSTVQTKPLFSTLSKVVMWANQPKLDDINSDVEICLDKEAIETTIVKLEEVADSFKPFKKNFNIPDDNSRQQIYYGAPGTGKSYRIKKQLEGALKENIFRTTFHPDSDYSTFVGAYKPTKGKKPLYGLNGGLTVRLNDGKEDLEEDIITYKFIPQAFLNAYIRAYQTDENVYLIIEEINRGNCAQIFGDLFQLLDRDGTGKSEYTIKADADLKAFLEEKLGEDNLGIKDGELCLPSNLYIYATMNTSDQSLFPIDSAFKRRWDWEYEPIKYKNTDWVIDIDGLKYRWSDFQKEVNTRILKDTGSEDKMLGDYFVNPPTKIISYNLFRNKILFYLWNDVCKDGDADIFPTDDDFSFSKLYDEDSKRLIVSMMDKLNLKPIEGDNGDNIEDNEDEMFEDDDSNTSSIRYSINGGKPFQKTNLASELFKEYIRLYPDISLEELISNWKNLEGKKPKHLIENESGYLSFIQDSKGDRGKNERRFEQLDYKGEKVYLWKGWGDGPQGNILPFMELINKSDWGIIIKRA